jgi:ABC-type amino acid transport substrate-binding protein
VLTYLDDHSQAKVVIELRRTTLLAIGLGFFVALWFLPNVVGWISRKPDEAWARVQRTGVIRFAINPTYMPFDGLGSHNDFFGIDVEMANEIAKRIGVRAEFVVTGHDSLYDVLEVGQADATISALIVNPIIAYEWMYSTPYFDAGQVMIRPARSAETSPVSIAVEYGSEGDAAARRMARRSDGVNIAYFQSAQEALLAVANGGTDEAIIDGVSAAQLLPKFPELQAVEQVTHDPYAIAVWGDSTQLLAAINAALAAMQKDGTTRRIIDEWMAR